MKRCYVTVAVVILVGFTSTAKAQRTGGRGGYSVGSSPAYLLSIEEVRKELNITSEQQEKLQALRGERGGFDNLSGEERQKRFEELTKKANETIKSVLDEKQQQRLGELQIQREGGGAIARAEIAEKLGLDQAQKDQLKKIQTENTPANVGNFRDATPEERRKMMTEFQERREKTNSAFLALLTPAQKEAFEKLQGAKFTFPEPRARNQ